jgi:mannosyltransferase
MLPTKLLDEAIRTRPAARPRPATPPPAVAQRSVGLRGIDPAIVVLTALAFAAAFYRLGSKGLWLDEAFSANYARLGANGLWQVVSGRDPNMSLYYAMLHFWVGLFGSQEAAIRSLGALLGALAIPFAVLLGTHLFGRATGLIAGLLLALNPFFVQYEQTARAYGLVILLLLISSYAFVLALERPTRARLLTYVLASALSFYAHYFAALVLLVQVGTLLALMPSRALRRRWAIAVGAVVVLCIPELVFASRGGAHGVEWIGTPTFGDLARIPAGIAGGTGLALLLSAFACYGLLRMVLSGRRWQAAFVFAWLLVPVVLDFVESRFGHPLFVAHYLIIVLPALLLLAAAGVAALPRKALAVGACGLLVVVAILYTRSWYTEPSLEGYRGATRFILGDAHSGDGIVLYPELPLGGPAEGVAYYEFRAGASAKRPVRLRLASAQQGQANRFWLVIRNSDVTAGGRKRIEHSLAANYTALRQRTSYRNLTVILYARRMRSRSPGIA